MKRKMKQFLGIMLSLALVLGLMPGMSLTARASLPEVKYLDADGIEQSLTEVYTTIPSTNPSTVWGQRGETSWYVVPAGNPVEISEIVTVSGNVNLIYLKERKERHRKRKDCPAVS